MKKNILIIGLIIVVVGIALLAFAGLQPWHWEQHSESEEIPTGMYHYWWFDANKGTRLEFSFSSNSSVDFLVMDSENYQLAVGGQSFTTIYQLLDTSHASFAFETPKTDRYYFVLDNFVGTPVSASVTWTISSGSLISYGAVVLIVVGASVAFLGIRLKPKIPPGLLDLVKTRRRIKIDELAKELRTTEARIEIGVNELMKAGHPIRFEAETREVVYG